MSTRRLQKKDFVFRVYLINANLSHVVMIALLTFPYRQLSTPKLLRGASWTLTSVVATGVSINGSLVFQFFRSLEKSSVYDTSGGSYISPECHKLLILYIVFICMSLHTHACGMRASDLLSAYLMMMMTMDKLFK